MKQIKMDRRLIRNLHIYIQYHLDWYTIPEQVDFIMECLDFEDTISNRKEMVEIMEQCELMEI